MSVYEEHLITIRLSINAAVPRIRTLSETYNDPDIPKALDSLLTALSAAEYLLSVEGRHD